MRILVVDSQAVTRRAVCSIIETDRTLSICGEAVDGPDAVEKAEALRPDIIVMDINIPGLSALRVSEEIKLLGPEAQIILMREHDSPQMIGQALEAAARISIPKSSISTDLLPAIAKIAERRHLRGFAEKENGNPNIDPSGTSPGTAPIEKALRESEERFRSAMGSMAEGLYTVDTGGLVTYINPSAEAMFGWTSAELLGKKMHDVTHYKHPDGTPFPAAECPGLQVLHKGVVLREHADVFIRKDGTFFPVLFSSSPLKNEDRIVGVVVCFRDDTKRRQAEEALRQNEEIYRAIGESIDYGIWICDAGGRNIYASSSFLKLVGLTQTQCSDIGWSHVLHPEDVEATTAAWRNCIRQGTPWEREHRLLAQDGKWRYVLARGIPIRSSQGNIQYWAGINLDIQRHKEAESQLQLLVRTLEARIVDRTQELQNATDKLRELSGRLLQTQDEERRRIARELHDGVGQLLVALNLNLSKLTSEKTKLSPGACQSLDENYKLIEQASQEIRTMSHLLHPPLLDEVGLESALRWYVEGFAERSKIDVHMDLISGFSQGLPRELSLSIFRIVQECLTNVHRHSESLTAVVRIARSAGEIVVEVNDRGKGIPVVTREKIASGASSGVGLRGMRERIRQFGGRLEIHSGQNGSRIVAVLPIPKSTEGPQSEAPALGQRDDEAPTNETAQEAWQAGIENSSPKVATILCIDDEVAGLLPRRLLLESAGHRVIEAHSGAEGLRLFQSEKVDAVILDYWMSGMKGTVVASELKRINPAVPIIVLSGMSDLPGEAAGIVDQWIVKGTTRAEQLLASVSSLLERGAV